MFKIAQNILNTHTKEIKIKTNDGTDSELFTMAYLYFLSLWAFSNLGFFDQNLKYCKKFSLMPTVTDTDLFDQTGFIIFKNQNLNFNVYK